MRWMLVVAGVVWIGALCMLCYTIGLETSTDTVRAARHEIQEAITKCLQISNEATAAKLRAHELEMRLIKLGDTP